ncbi:DNA-binding transcriptional regulator GbsR (MarR family) [Pullulanibacillus pueri]|uniref:HTH-type transcriptional regulator n=1 Tax=Pullulanibacillus pueri TaxID=1437324 RepID=A0A8J2ZXP3_9BACL|nr:GbsR/MarR family transcriptional regulator [Pullulanibacillus pueri]MBM7683857.1 DNA-binding transcriptional regulator GbsR (MarR family) [Pullulanibacillus pueri]GGH84578.1 HTH-type transcriptional repressor OpcR [Pullulanibacillus pueri]
MGDVSSNMVEQTKEHFIEKIADNMRAFGISPTLGRVLGIIYMNKEPMTLDQLSEATGMSKTRMSQVVREMIDLNIADKVFEKGVRKDLYTVEQDYYQTFISLFISNWRQAINKSRLFEQKWRQRILDIKNEGSLSPDVENEINELLKETQIWLAYYDWISRLVDFFESGEVFKHVPKKRVPEFEE